MEQHFASNANNVKEKCTYHIFIRKSQVDIKVRRNSNKFEGKQLCILKSTADERTAAVHVSPSIYFACVNLSRPE